MKDLFNRFRQSGKIEDYLKYREEISKEFNVDKENEDEKGNNSKHD